MKPDKQRIVIAEACGWEWKPYGDTMAWYFKGVMRWFRATCGLDKSRIPVEGLPDYLNDLNAIHEAEKTLSFDQMHVTFIGLLQGITQRDWINGDKSAMQTAVHATAKQRAEAFLKTIGKWV